jgi:hypothetical protein
MSIKKDKMDYLIKILTYVTVGLSMGYVALVVSAAIYQWFICGDMFVCIGKF